MRTTTFMQRGAGTVLMSALVVAVTACGRALIPTCRLRALGAHHGPLRRAVFICASEIVGAGLARERERSSRRDTRGLWDQGWRVQAEKARAKSRKSSRCSWQSWKTMFQFTAS